MNDRKADYDVDPVRTATKLRARLTAAFQRSDQIFALLAPEALMERPIALRHPFIFYLGHLPAFAWNQIGRGVLGRDHLRRDFDLLFSRGIDPADAEQARDVAIHAWPALGEVLAYRDQVRAAVTACIPELLAQTDDPLCVRGRVVHMVIEHELMHHETLLYMLQEHDPDTPRRSVTAPAPIGGAGRAAESRRIPAGTVTVGVDFESIEFGWDNEFGHLTVAVPDFTLDSLPVRNSDYLAFLDRQGASARAGLMPHTWIERAGQILVKTVFGPVPFALAEGWPVQVSGTAARAYCAARGGRLPTEAELRRASRGAEQGNLDFRHWSPLPVGNHPAGASAYGVEELIGNGWEWTSTVFGPLPGFTPYARTYPGYSTDFFDDEHDVVFGASWATDAALVRPSFRNWFRRDYPYVFSSFRVARDI